MFYPDLILCILGDAVLCVSQAHLIWRSLLVISKLEFVVLLVILDAFAKKNLGKADCLLTLSAMRLDHYYLLTQIPKPHILQKRACT